MRILYIGEDSPYSTSFHRAEALRRIGCSVNIINPNSVTKRIHKIKYKIHYRTGYRFLQKRMLLWLDSELKSKDYDLVWINSGELFGEECLNLIKQKLKVPIILYNNDDPTGGRDGRRFDSLLKAIPNYDMCVVMRDINVNEYTKLGARKVLKVYMSYDEIYHAPISNNNFSDSFKSEVSFIGTNIPNDNRDIFLHTLIKYGVPLSIWGGRWEKSPYWNQLKPYFKGQTLKGKDYISAIQGSKICLGLLSKGNRDLHTTRTFEIPFIGSLLCAERTSEHLELFDENLEAVFWNSAEECAEKCKELLKNQLLINQISNNGRKRLINDGRGNENVVKHILSEINN
ncbi:MAG: hypothetical protein CML05_03760 [Pseudozobellia sp.]|nr:hypothetical protein [Pseudozobellia sp.]|tara:strand:- start:56612 stop:57640 length:1029 start_codon:yes stop_codon:yes gene_type:complete